MALEGRVALVVWLIRIRIALVQRLPHEPTPATIPRASGTCMQHRQRPHPLPINPGFPFAVGHLSITLLLRAPH